MKRDFELEKAEKRLAVHRTACTHSCTLSEAEKVFAAFPMKKRLDIIRQEKRSAIISAAQRIA